jgi:hypothetical protein
MHYDGENPAACADSAASALIKLGEAKPRTSAEKGRERVRQAKASGNYRERIKKEPVQRPARIRLISKKPLFR